MTDIFVGFASALWLGLLTAISPCPLASNVAAISFLSKKIAHPALVFISGAAYTLGRMVAYAAIGWLIIHSLLGVPQVAQFLQKYMGRVLGPFLVFTGLILLEIIPLRFSGLSLSQKQSRTLAEAGAPGAFLLGFVLSLAFCPISAALFFGSLIPLALNSRMGALLPFIYGIGTGLPVLAFALAIALGVTSLSRWFHRITQVESYTRKITGAVFILAGAYYFGVYWVRIF